MIKFNRHINHKNKISDDKKYNSDNKSSEVNTKA